MNVFGLFKVATDSLGKIHYIHHNMINTSHLIDLVTLCRNEMLTRIDDAQHGEETKIGNHKKHLKS